MKPRSVNKSESANTIGVRSSEQPRTSLLALINQYNEDELNRSQASATAVKLQHVEIGYFQTLNANFRSTEEEIRNCSNYLQRTTAIDKEIQKADDSMPRSVMRNHIRDLKNIITAYQFLSEEDERNKYINMIRLRSIISQHLNTKAAMTDGYLYPFMTFSVMQGEDQRMLELNFVENVMMDRFKDHISRSYHFSMIKRVVKGFKYDELFIEFNNDRPITYCASFPLQRDFIVEVINLAIDEIKYLNLKNKGINNPDNHNLSKKSTAGDDIYVKTSLDLNFIMDDHVLPPKSLAKAKILKKNKSIGYETRYLLLGHTQLVIARDRDFNNIVNVIPLEGGYVLINKPRDFPGLIISTHQRNYTIKFPNPDDLVKWYHLLQSVVSKEVKVQEYAVRKKEQDEKISGLNKQSQYKKIVTDIEDRLNELKKLVVLKKRFEKENQGDEDDYIDTIKEASNMQQLASVIMANLVQNANTSELRQQSGQQTSSQQRKTLQNGKRERKVTLNTGATAETLSDQDGDGSDNDEFIVHQEGHEEIHITRKAKKQLKMPVAHFKVVKTFKSMQQDDNAEDDGIDGPAGGSSSYKSSQKRSFHK